VENELAGLKLKYEDLNDKYLRLFSDFDNYRKRSLKEKIELSKTASEEVIVELLGVIDDFERALQALEKDSPSFEGLNLIYNKLLKILKQKGLQEIEAKGTEFDTDYHEALTNVPAPEEQLKGKVIEVIQKGYTLSGKVIRYAKVVVGA
jgi:molecular chaperone GrpE